MSQTEYEYQKGEQIQCVFLVRLMSEVSKTPTRTFRIGSLIQQGIKLPILNVRVGVLDTSDMSLTKIHTGSVHLFGTQT